MLRKQMKLCLGTSVIMLIKDQEFTDSQLQHVKPRSSGSRTTAPDFLDVPLKKNLHGA